MDNNRPRKRYTEMTEQEKEEFVQRMKQPISGEITEEEMEALENWGSQITSFLEWKITGKLHLADLTSKDRAKIQAYQEQRRREKELKQNSEK